jgi:hypothetical protein
MVLLDADLVQGKVRKTDEKWKPTANLCFVALSNHKLIQQ